MRYFGNLRQSLRAWLGDGRADPTRTIRASAAGGRIALSGAGSPARLLSVVLLLLAVTPRPAQAEEPVALAPEPGLFGARSLDRGDWGAWIAIGVPDVEVGARFGQSGLTDMGARLRLSGGTGSTLGGFGASAAALLRLRVARLGSWDLAIIAEPGLTGHAGARSWAPRVAAGQVGQTGLFGVDLGVPGAVASSWLSPSILLAVGVAAPLRVWVAPEPTLEVPVLLRVAMEARVDGRWSALAAGEVGTSLYGPGAGVPTADVLWRLGLGVGWR